MLSDRGSEIAGARGWATWLHLGGSGYVSIPITRAFGRRLEYSAMRLIGATVSSEPSAAS